MVIVIWSDYYPDYTERLAAMSQNHNVQIAFYNADKLELV